MYICVFTYKDLYISLSSPKAHERRRHQLVLASQQHLRPLPLLVFPELRLHVERLRLGPRDLRAQASGKRARRVGLGRESARRCGFQAMFMLCSCYFHAMFTLCSCDFSTIFMLFLVFSWFSMSFQAFSILFKASEALYFALDEPLDVGGDVGAGKGASKSSRASSGSSFRFQ